MNSEVINSNTSIRTNSSSDSGVVAKIRRLKIQEGLFLQHINKFIPKSHYNDENNVTNSSSDNKLFISNLRNSYSEIKHIFDSVKNNISSHEILDSTDIDDLKKDVIELDSKIKKFKSFLSSKLITLKSNEQDLTKKLNEITDEAEKLRKHSKMEIKPHIDLVPSPVKNVINSPFKCPEVQQFQEFMLKSKNRYGGWLEYNHNIFVQCWRKHFDIKHNTNLKYDDINVEDSIFVKDIVEKISGITKQDVAEHIEWYSKYLHYKTRQQEALDNWKAKRRIIKKNKKCNERSSKDILETEKKVRVNSPRRLINSTVRRDKKFQNVVSDEMKKIEKLFLCESIKQTHRTSRSTVSCHSSDCKAESDEQLFHYAKSTEQWNNKCQSSENRKQHAQNILLRLEDIKKL